MMLDNRCLIKVGGMVMNMRALFLSILFGMIFVGCARTAMPNNFGGKFYMSGDDNCVRARKLSDTRIMCIDANGKETGYREAMTDQEISMYQHNRMIAQQESAELSRSLDNLNNQLNYNNQQMLNRNNVYKVRPVGPYGF